MGKEPARFRLPPPPMDRDQAAKLRLLMVGPGTGVAVFLSFCHFLLKRKLETSPSYENVERILFFGCRDIEKDGIYIEELRGFVREGILTELIVCESQKNGERVQDGLKKNLEKVTSFLNPSTDSKIFICGDAKGMSKDVWQCFSDILAQNENISDLDAKKRLMDLKKSDQYIEDVWACRLNHLIISLFNNTIIITFQAIYVIFGNPGIVFSYFAVKSFQLLFLKFVQRGVSLLYACNVPDFLEMYWD